MFDKLLNLPIDFFERTQTGRVAHEVNQIWKIRTFLMSQLFGTVLDSTTLLIFLPIMFFFSPIMTFVVVAACGLMALWIIVDAAGGAAEGRRRWSAPNPSAAPS